MECSINKQSTETTVASTAPTAPMVILDGLSLAVAQSEVSHDWMVLNTNITSLPALASRRHLGGCQQVTDENIQKLRNSPEFFFLFFFLLPLLNIDTTRMNYTSQ